MKTPVETLAANFQTLIEAKVDFLANSEQHPIFEAAVLEVILRYQKGGRLYIAGNGGSAADVQHLAAEFVQFGFKQIGEQSHCSQENICYEESLRHLSSSNS